MERGGERPVQCMIVCAGYVDKLYFLALLNIALTNLFTISINYGSYCKFTVCRAYYIYKEPETLLQANLNDFPKYLGALLHGQQNTHSKERGNRRTG